MSFPTVVAVADGVGRRYGSLVDGDQPAGVGVVVGGAGGVRPPVGGDVSRGVAGFYGVACVVETDEAAGVAFVLIVGRSRHVRAGVDAANRAVVPADEPARVGFLVRAGSGAVGGDGAQRPGFGYRAAVLARQGADVDGVGGGGAGDVHVRQRQLVNVRA